MNHTKETYVMSIIRLPLLIHDDGTYTTLHDSIRMEFEPCPELPPQLSPEQHDESTARLTELIADLCIASNTTSNMTIESESSSASSSSFVPCPCPCPCPWPTILDRSLNRRRIGRPTTFKNYATKLSTVNTSAPYKRRHTVRNL